MPRAVPANFFRLLVRRRLRHWSRQREFRYRVRPGLRPNFQVQVRARGGPFAAEVQLRPRTSDLLIFEQIFVRGFYDLHQLWRWPDIQAGSTDLGGEALILDLGANIGLSSLYFSKNFPQAHVLAVEPSPDNFDLLRANLAGRERVQCVAAAAAACDGRARIANPEGPTAAYRIETSSKGNEGTIPAMSVASILRLAPPSAVPFLAKIDIEGFERDLFAQNLEWVERFPILVVEPHDWMLPGQASSTHLLRALARLQRDFILLGESVVSLAVDWPRKSTGNSAQIGLALEQPGG